MKKSKLLLGGLLLALFASGTFSATLANTQNEAIVVNAADYSTYWSGIDTSGNTTGNTFRASLQSIMKSKGTKTGSNSYKQLNAIFEKSDADPNDSSKIIPFYRAPSESVTPSWNSNINKEHTWPNSRGAGENAGYAGTDPQVVRPTLKDDNSGRGNSMFAESGAFDPAYYGYEPARGEAARIILYAATMYYNKSCSGAGGSSKGSNPLELTNNVADSASNCTMGKLSDLLKWNTQYPVTAAEKRRNDYLTSINYARNPFIDNPDWANFIWDNNGIRQSSYDPSSSSSYVPVSSSSEETPSGSKYEMITDTRELVIGDHYAVAALEGTSYHAMKNAMKATYYIDQVDVNVTDGILTSTSGMSSFVLEAGSAEDTYAFHDETAGYLNGVISGEHYNVGYQSSGSIGDTDWTITAASGGFKMVSGNGVYPSYYAAKYDFTGSQNPTTMYLFRLTGTPSSSMPGTSTPTTSQSSSGHSPLSHPDSSGTGGNGCNGSIVGTLAVSAFGLCGLGLLFLKRKK